MSETITEYHGHRIRILREPYRRNLKLTAEVRGDLRLRVGKSVSERQILQFLQQNLKWIERACARFAQERERFPQKKFVTGENFLFLGRDCPLEFLPFDGRKPQIVLSESALSVFIPQDGWTEEFPAAAHPEFQELIVKKFEQQARKLLPQRVAIWSERTGLRPAKLSLRAQRSRWGSLSSSGRISLNWKLIAAPIEVIDYVIIHELCHMVHANHSSHFWNLVASWDPQYKEHRLWLRTHHLAFDFLAKRYLVTFVDSVSPQK